MTSICWYIGLVLGFTIILFALHTAQCFYHFISCLFSCKTLFTYTTSCKMFNFL